MTVLSALNTLALGVASGFAHSAIQIAWLKITHRKWEDLFYDSFSKAFKDLRSLLKTYTQDGEPKFDEVAFRKLLRQNLALNVDTLSLSETGRAELTRALAERMSQANILILGGHTLSSESYQQLIHNLIKKASAEFKAAVLSNEAPFRQAVLAELQGNQTAIGEVQELLKNRFDIVVDFLESIKDDTAQIPGIRDIVEKIDEKLSARGSVSRFPVYANIPTNLDQVVGQEEFINRLAQRLTTESGSVLALEGLGGIGKTTLATAIAHHVDVQAHFSEGVLWASLGPSSDASKALVAWLEELGQTIPQTTDIAQLANQVKNAVGNHRILFVIDDAWDANIARILCCGGPNCRYLLTTRDQGVARAFAGTPSRVESVPFLSDEVAYEWLKELAPEACKADPETARALAVSVGGLPLAIKLLGGYLGDPERSAFADLQADALEDMQNLQNLLKETHQRLENLSREETLRETILLSLEALPEPAIKAFHALGAFAPKPDSFTREAAEVVAETDSPTLAKLVSRNLVEKLDGERLSLHQVIVSAAEEDEQARLQHLDYYIYSAQNNQENWRKMGLLYGQLKQARNTAGAVENFDALVKIVEASTGYQMKRGLWNDAAIWITEALGIMEKYRSQLTVEKYRTNKGVLLTGRGLTSHYLNKGSEALQDLDTAVSLLEGVRQPKHLISALNARGMVYRLKGETKSSLSDYKRAMRLALRETDLASLGITLQRLGALYNGLKAYDLGWRYSQHASLILGSNNNQAVLASALNNMGQSYVRGRMLAEGIDCYKRSLQIREEIGAEAGRDKVLTNLGKAYIHYSQCTSSLEKIGLTSPKRYRLELALEKLSEAFQIAANAKDMLSQGNLLNLMGGVCETMQDKENALTFFRAALPYCQGNKGLEREVRRNIALSSDDLTEGVEQLKTVVKISELMQHEELEDDRQKLIHCEELLAGQ